VPGRIDWKTSEGCLRLIREGARMVTSVDDIVEELTPLGKSGTAAPARAVRSTGASGAVRAPTPPSPPRPVAAAPEMKLSLEEAMVLREIPEGGIAIDAVTRATGLAAARVNTLVIGLRLKGRLRLLPGNRVAIG